MKPKVLGLLAVALLAGPAAANAIEIGPYTFTWEITKVGDNNLLVLSPGQSFFVNYEVSLSANGVPIENGVLNGSGSDVDECVLVTDSLFGTLGSVCAGSGPVKFNYGLLVGPYEVGEHTFTNIASFVTNDSGVTGQSSWTVDVEVPGASVPEPGTLALLGLGLAGLGLSRRRKAA